MANEMLWSVQSGFLTNTKLNKAFRRVAQPMMKFRQFCDVKEAFGRNAGESVNWMKVSNIGSYGKRLVETNTMPESTQPLLWGAATVAEFGNSIPWTFKTEALSQFDVEEILRSGLVDDMAKCIDGLIEHEFASTPLKAAATNSTAGIIIQTGGTTTCTNTNIPLTTYHVRKIALELKKRNVPGFSKLGGNYVGILSVEAADNIRAEFESGYLTAAQGTETGLGVILNGEVGKLHGVRLVEDTFASRFIYDKINGTATAKTYGVSNARVAGQSAGDFAQSACWSVATGVSGDAYFFGSPTVREVIAVPEEIRRKIPTDYGRSKGLGWYAILGYEIEWGTSDSAGTFTAAQADNARIVHWTSL